MTFHSPNKYLPENHSYQRHQIAGCDEAGRGPWAGPVVAAAVIIPNKIQLPGLRDSKKIKESDRERLYELIIKKCHFGVGIIGQSIIDEQGLLAATFQAYQSAINKLTPKPEILLVDGRDNFNFTLPRISIVKGDDKLRCIAAASILAKVTRDRIMVDYSAKYPQYGFEKHKGYGTRLHQQLIEKHGVCALHRQSFKPIQECIKNQ